MRSLDPADVFGNRRIRSIVRFAGNCCASTNDETEPADDIHVEYLSAQGGILRAEISQRAEFIIELHEVGAAGRKPERTNNVRADQKGISKRDRIFEASDGIRIDESR